MTTQWRRAPFALVHHRSVLLALFVAAGLVALTAASSPLLSAAGGGGALKNGLVRLTPRSAGLVIEAAGVGPSGSERPAAYAARRDAAIARLAEEIGSLEPPVRTLILGGSNMSMGVASAGGQV